MPPCLPHGSAKRGFAWAAVVAGMPLVAVLLRLSGGSYTQILLSIVVAGTGVLLVRFHFTAMCILPRAVWFGLLVTLAWQICTLALVWTSLRSNLFLWRLTWVLLITALTSTYVLSVTGVDSSRRSVLKTAVVGCGAVLGLMLMYPAMTAAFPSFPSAAFFWAMSIPAVGTVLGPAALRRWPTNGKLRISGASPSRRARRHHQSLYRLSNSVR